MWELNPSFAKKLEELRDSGATAKRANFWEHFRIIIGVFVN